LNFKDQDLEIHLLSFMSVGVPPEPETLLEPPFAARDPFHSGQDDEEERFPRGNKDF